MIVDAFASQAKQDSACTKLGTSIIGQDTIQLLQQLVVALGNVTGGGGGGGGGFKPFPELALGNADDFHELVASDMGKMVTDRDATGDNYVQIGLPTLAAAIATGESIMIRSTRKENADKFIVQPNWSDIVGYWSRLISVGARLAEFSVAMLDAGQSLILTPREVGQMQLDLNSVSGTFAVGNNISGSLSGATGKVLDVVLDKDGSTILQILVTDGTFVVNDDITNAGDGFGVLFRNPVDCTWMWEADFMTGAVVSSDEGNQRYQNWY